VAIRRVLAVLTVLLFIEDFGTTYATHWLSPLGWLHDSFFFLKMPHLIRPFDHVLFVCLLLALGRADGKGPRVAPMRSTLLLSLATIVVWFALGLSRGGDLRFGCWQIYIPLSGILFAFTIAAAFRTPQHYAMLAKALLIAAAYRAVMCWCFYFLYVRSMAMPTPEFITLHDDSALWVVALLILVLRMMRASRSGDRLWAGLFALFLVGAVQFNSRRLAWVELAMGLVVLFLLMPPGRARRRATRVLMVLTPVVLIYVGVGWGRPERIFKPLQAFSSITTVEDASTKSRNVENLGLIHTAQINGWLVGTGWGHEYTPVSMKYALGQYFELWRYIPHNSILGLFAFMGAIGYCGYWVAYPTAMFLNARIAKMSKSEAARDVGLIGAAQMVVCVNQYFGDMGMFSYKVVYIMSTSFAIALRLPIMSGVWTAVGAKAARKTPSRQEGRVQGDAWQS
jgi:hypothetical protein